MVNMEIIKKPDSKTDYNIDYSFIDNFFENGYSQLLCDLLDNKALIYWVDHHYENNSSLLDEIEASYNHLKAEEYERDLCFENLVEAFDSLELFDVNSSDVEGLSPKSIDTLIEYNDNIKNFKNKFNEVKDELAIKVGITENS